MQSAPNRNDEAACLQALRDLAVLDSAPEPEFDALVRVASVLCGAPIALISLVDADRQWFKARVGLPGQAQTPRAISFCGHAVLSAGVFEVPDAQHDIRFADNPLVTGPPHVRHYAGAPVRLSDGLCVGTICVLNSVPGRLDEHQIDALSGLATAVAHSLEGRHAVRVALKCAAAHGSAQSTLPVNEGRIRTAVADLARQHEMLHAALGSVSDAVLATDPQGNVRWLNPVAERLTGWTSLASKGKPFATCLRTVDPDTRTRIDGFSGPWQQDGAPGPDRRSLLLARDGQELLIEGRAASMRSESGESLGGVLVFRDVSESNRVSRELSHQASRDPLTGLYNRVEFEKRLARAWLQTQEGSIEHALMFIDLDQFRVINDACGHAAGDQVLREVGQLLSGLVRANDTVARIGGDDFALILERCPADHALALAQTICDRLENYRFMQGQQRFRIGTSIGLVPVDPRWSTTAQILLAAEASCMAASEAGGSRVHVWRVADAVLDDRRGAMQWATRIEQALDEDRFELFAQRIEPVAQPCSGVHAEVLIRMVDTDGQLIPPGVFLPAAERFHLATRIDRWVLKRAMAWLKSLPSLDLVTTLSLNLSGQSVGDPTFQCWAIETLADAGSTLCQSLCFEITETAAVSNMAVAADFVAKIRAQGVRVALDDFGVGASSFGYLKNFQIDYLKIDGQFIQDLLTDPLNDAAVRCFADVARVIGVKTVAEFVDHPAVLARLGEIGVDFAQGYLLHKPAPLDALLGPATVSPVRQSGSGIRSASIRPPSRTAGTVGVKRSEAVIPCE